MSGEGHPSKRPSLSMRSIRSRITPIVVYQFAFVPAKEQCLQINDENQHNVALSLCVHLFDIRVRETGRSVHSQSTLALSSQ